MADRSPQAIPADGLVATYHAASAGGDRVRPGSILHVKNANAASTVITMTTTAVVDGDLAVADRTRTVVNGTDRFLPVPTDTAYQDGDGWVGIAWSVTASVTFAVLTRS